MAARDSQRPTWRYEDIARAEGRTLVAGVDEVGRGPLAGPVVAGAVVLPQRRDLPWFDLLDDSKRLTPHQREDANTRILSSEASVGIGAASPEEIDRLGIAVATRLAMVRAIEGLEPQPEHLLIDAVQLRECPIPQTSIIKGDSLSKSIAAASIVAKVARDDLMVRVLHERFPGYGFDHNKGYGTPAHLAAIRRAGPCAAHRRSFAPVRDALIDGDRPAVGLDAIPRAWLGAQQP